MEPDIDWSKYKLRDLPVLSTYPLIDVKSNDQRTNGQLFCEEVAQDSLTKLSNYVDQGSNPIFLNSQDSVLGTGKSAVLAAEYWRLRGKRETCFWVNVVGESPMKTILLKVAYEMYLDGAIDEIKKKLTQSGKELSRIDAAKWSKQPLTKWFERTISGVTEDFPLALADVKRKTRAFTVTEAFIFVLDVYRSLVAKKVYIFLDQLEMYVRYRSATRVSLEMNELQRGIADKAVILGTMHTDSLFKLQTQCGPDVQTFMEHTPVIQLPRYSPQDLVKIGAYLLSKFRKGEAEKYYPFTSESISLIADKSANNIRKFLVRMRAALMYGAISGYPALDKKLLSSDAAKARIFLLTSQ
jgi:hypothetical protein